MARLIGDLQGLGYMATPNMSCLPLMVLHVVSSQQLECLSKLRPQLECSYVKAQLGVEWPSSTVQISLNWRLMAAEAPMALLTAPEMAPEMELAKESEMEPARVLGTAQSNQWALSFQSWLSFAKWPTPTVR
ncbi:hypothetical protein AAG906_035496 [Vitis piasezkii]